MVKHKVWHFVLPKRLEPQAIDKSSTPNPSLLVQIPRWHNHKYDIC